MKQLSLILLSAIIPMAAFSQVHVNRHGQIVVGPDGLSNLGGGTTLSSAKTTGAVVFPSLQFETDSVAAICVLGDNYNRSGGYIAFGDKSYVRVGEYGSSSSDSNKLQLYASGGLRYDSPYGNVFSCTGTGTAKPTFTFNCNVKVDGVYVTSDSRLKGNVQTLEYSPSNFDGISTVSYTLDAPTATRASKSAAEGVGEDEIPGRIPADNRERFGFIAQEVREIFPQLVSEDEDGYLSVDYIGFIPLLVDAVKQLSAKVEEQQYTIATLTAQQPSRKQNSQSGLTDLPGTVASLAQNRPNPFSQTTVIELTLPESTSEAYVCIYDLQGRQVMRLPVEGRGVTSVTVDGSSLQPGMFIYTLIADGQEVATKRMILTD